MTANLVAVVTLLSDAALLREKLSEREPQRRKDGKKREEPT